MSKKKKILIIAPTNKNGGRELETGFIGSVLSSEFDVSLVSTAQYFKDSQVLEFSGFKYTSLNEEIYRGSWVVRCVIGLVSLLKSGISNSSRALSVPGLKKRLNVEGKKIALLKAHVESCDLVLICAQVYSNYVAEVIKFAKTSNKKVAFRTTGTIYRDERLRQLSWIEDVDRFIHHSEANASKIKDRNDTYVIIDQCAYRESELLEVPITAKKINRYFMLTRLTAEKRVGLVIEAFKNVSGENRRLRIYGEGKEMSQLQLLAEGEEGIEFMGQITQGQIVEAFKDNDCLIISSLEEAGPLNGIEVMASGKVVMSTKVGAMPERFGDEAIWFDGTVDGLISKLKELEELAPEAIETYGKRTRQRYIEHYSINKVAEKYLNCLRNLLTRDP